MGDIESLLISNNIDGSRWMPITVSNYRKDLSYGNLSDLADPSRSNIAYNLQYLQYIELQLRDLNLTSPIKCLLYKNFIIVATSIIELVFYHLIKKYGKIKHEEYELIHSMDISLPQYFAPREPVDKYKLQCFKKLEQAKEVQPNFHSLIQSVKDHHLLTDVNFDLNKDYITHLRKNLRNKIHLTIAEDFYQTDYNTFSYIDYVSAKVFLFNILTDSSFDRDKQIYLPRIYNASVEQIEAYIRNNSNQFFKWIN